MLPARSLPSQRTHWRNRRRVRRRTSGRSFKYNLRFAGQIFDWQAGLHANGFRDCYAPVTGRYCEPDPIGLYGGINPYAYALGRPLFFTDPTGLATAIVIGGATGMQAFGHAAVATTGQGVFSNGSSDLPGASFTQYLQTQEGMRNQVVFVLPTTPDQESSIVARMRASIHRGWDLVDNNCSNSIVDALWGANVATTQILDAYSSSDAAVLPTPDTLETILLSVPDAQMYVIRSGDPIPAVFSQFNKGR